MRTGIFNAGFLAGLLLVGATAASDAANISIGGGGGSVASVSSGNAANTSSTANVGTGSGPLATVNGNGSNNDAAVNLGSLRGNGQIANTVNGLLANDGLNGVGTPGPGAGATPSPIAVADQLNGLSSSQRAGLKMRCADILGSPGAFDAQLTALCRIIARSR